MRSRGSLCAGCTRPHSHFSSASPTHSGEVCLDPRPPPSTPPHYPRATSPCHLPPYPSYNSPPSTPTPHPLSLPPKLTPTPSRENISLTALSLGMNGIDAAVATELAAALSTHPCLEALQLPHNPVGGKAPKKTLLPFPTA